MSDVLIEIEEAYQDGYNKGFRDLALQVLEVLNNPKIAIYHKEKRIKEIIENGYIEEQRRV